jgi:hypothetical protein
MTKRFKNQLLTVLPPDVFTRWLPHLEWVDMPLGAVLYESSGKMTHVYWSEDSIESLLFVLENGSWAEIVVVKKEYDRLLPHLEAV